MMLASPNLNYLQGALCPSWLINTLRGPIVVSPKPRVRKDLFIHPSPLMRAKAEVWKSHYPPKWDNAFLRALPLNATIRD